MKKLLILLIAIIPIWSNAQTSQVKVSLRNGTSIEGIVKEFDALDNITIIVGGVESTIPMSQVAYVSNIGEQTQQSSNTVIDSSSDQKEKIAVVVEDPLKDFKGFLLEKGNNVYVYYANSDRDSNAQYDKEGAMVIKSLLKKDGFWNVVDKMSQAHFTINFCVITRGADNAQLSVSSWRTGKIHKLGYEGTSEDLLKNNVIAQHFYKKAIRKLQQKIEKGKVSKKMREDFTVK